MYLFIHVPNSLLWQAFLLIHYSCGLYQYTVFGGIQICQETAWEYNKDIFLYRLIQTCQNWAGIRPMLATRMEPALQLILALGPISLSFSIAIQIQWKFCLLSPWFSLSDHYKILHMTSQLCCYGICNNSAVQRRSPNATHKWNGQPILHLEWSVFRLINFRWIFRSLATVCSLENTPIALKFDRQLGTTGSGPPIKFQNYWRTLKRNLMRPRLNDILGYRLWWWWKTNGTEVI